MTSWPRIRNVILFFGGLGGFGHELLIYKGSERPFILSACMALIGLPSFLPGTNGKKFSLSFGNGNGTTPPPSNGSPSASPTDT